MSKDSVSVNPKKKKAIDKCPVPTCMCDFQVFLSMCNYYAKSVKLFESQAAPLYALLHKDTPWQWSPTCQQAFETLKYTLTHAPVLCLPDSKLLFVVEMDASNFAIGGGVLTQADQPVAYFSMMLNSA